MQDQLIGSDRSEEGATRALGGPEKIGFVVRVDAFDLALRRDDLHSRDAGASGTPLPIIPANAAAEDEAAESDIPAMPDRKGQAMPGKRLDQPPARHTGA